VTHGWYITSIALHIVAASLWVGGMLFLVLVLVPALRRLAGPPAGGAADPGHRTPLPQSVGWATLGVFWSPPARPTCWPAASGLETSCGHRRLLAQLVWRGAGLQAGRRGRSSWSSAPCTTSGWARGRRRRCAVNPTDPDALRLRVDGGLVRAVEPGAGPGRGGVRCHAGARSAVVMSINQGKGVRV
jgi:hypothetical protein